MFVSEHGTYGISKVLVFWAFVYLRCTHIISHHLPVHLPTKEENITCISHLSLFHSINFLFSLHCSIPSKPQISKISTAVGEGGTGGGHDSK